MLRIIDDKNKLPNHFPVDYSVEFKPGLIAQFHRKNGVIVCGVSDGTGCVGIIDDMHNSFGTSVASGDIKIWNVKGMIAETDQFELNDEMKKYISMFYKPGNFLYINHEGKLTPIQQASFIMPTAQLLSFRDHTIRFEWLRKKS